MNVRPSMMLGVVLAACALTLGISARRARASALSRSSAQARLVSLASDAQELVDLQACQETIGSGQRPSQDVIAQVTATLARVGLPSERLKDLAQQSDTALASPPGFGPDSPSYRQQSVRFTIEPLTAPELGEFLNNWRSAQRVWTVTQIEFTHAGRDEDLSFRFVLQIAAVYLSSMSENREQLVSTHSEEGP